MSQVESELIIARNLEKARSKSPVVDETTPKNHDGKIKVFNAQEAENVIQTKMAEIEMLKNGQGFNLQGNLENTFGSRIISLDRSGTSPKLQQAIYLGNNKVMNSKDTDKSFGAANKLFNQIKNSLNNNQVKNSVGSIQPMTTNEFIDPTVVEQTFTDWDTLRECFKPTIRANGLGTQFVKKWRQVIASLTPESYFTSITGDNTPNAIDVNFDALDLRIYFLQSQIGYNTLQNAAVQANGINDLIGKKTRAAAIVSELAFQRTLAMGVSKVTGSKGLLNQTPYNINTTTISTPTANLTNAQFTAVVNQICSDSINSMYLSGKKLDTLVIPFFEKVAMMTTPYVIGDASTTQTTVAMSRWDWLVKKFTDITEGKGKILCCPYADQTYNAPYSNGSNNLNQNIWALYNKDYLEAAETFPFTQTGFMSANGFNFNAVNTMSFSDVLLTNPRSMVLYTYTN